MRKFAISLCVVCLICALPASGAEEFKGTIEKVEEKENRLVVKINSRLRSFPIPAEIKLTERGGTRTLKRDNRADQEQFWRALEVGNAVTIRVVRVADKAKGDKMKTTLGHEFEIRPRR